MCACAGSAQARRAVGGARHASRVQEYEGGYSAFGVLLSDEPQQPLGQHLALGRSLHWLCARVSGRG